MRLGYAAVQFPLLENPGPTGGPTGGGGAPSGGSGSPSPTGSGAAGSGAPSPISLSNDALISFEGAKEPVKFGDWRNKYVDKAEYTKATQDRARLNEELARMKGQLEAFQTRPQGPTAPSGPTEFEKQIAALAEQPYVSGASVAQIVGTMVQQGFQPLVEGLKVRDEAIKLLSAELQNVKGMATGLRNTSFESSIQGLYGRAAKALNLPADNPQVKELFDDIYRSHTGWENGNDEEFIGIAKARIAALTQLVREGDKQAAEQARENARRGIFGQGGGGSPSLPARPAGFETPDQIAKKFFPLISGATNT